MCAAPSGAGPADRQFLFTVYVHPHPEFPGFDAGSTFHGHDVPDRIQVGPKHLPGRHKMAVGNELCLQPNNDLFTCLPRITPICG